jgi:hypothetical protein
MIRSLLALALALSACGPSRRDVPRSDAPAKPNKDGDIVAFLNGEPITRAEVADRLLDLEPRRSVDVYIRWKILEQARARLGIANTPEELAKRADVMIAEYKKLQGEAEFRRQLEAEGYTEEAYRDFVAKNRLFVEKLTLEKMVRYSFLAEGWVETDRMLFADEEDAKAFLASAREKGFGPAVDAIKEARGRTVRRPREVWLRDLAPADLSPETVEKAFGAAEGAILGVERGRGGVSIVLQVKKRVPPSQEKYGALRGRVFEWILAEPPREEELSAWIDLQLKRSRIEYADRGSKGN